MKSRIYLETSFISYLASNASREPITAQRQSSSNYWWTTQRAHFELCISARVFQECQKGDSLQVQKRIALLEETKLLPLNEEIMELAEHLLAPGCVPSVAASDAIHIAAATIHDCEYLLTWNFRHIANARIRRNAERIIENYGYQPPIICTPDELSELAAER